MNPELKALLTALFGLAEDADEEAILAAGREYVRKLHEQPAPEAAPEPAQDTAALSARLDALSAALDDLRRQALIEAATREGKVVPAAARDLPIDKLAALCAELPATVPLTPLTPAAARPEPLSHLSPTDLLVCQQLGLEPQSLTK